MFELRSTDSRGRLSLRQVPQCSARVERRKGKQIPLRLRRFGM